MSKRNQPVMICGRPPVIGDTEQIEALRKAGYYDEPIAGKVKILACVEFSYITRGEDSADIVLCIDEDECSSVDDAEDIVKRHFMLNKSSYCWSDAEDIEIDEIAILNREDFIK